MEFDQLFWTGLAATVSAILVFCGSVWLLLSMIMGRKLAYLVTASITLAFVFIMGLVWSFVQLGPVGELPEFLPEALGEGGDVEFGAAGSYPNEPWREANQDDEAEVARVAEAEGTALDAVEEGIQEGAVTAFEAIDQAAAVADSTRFLEQEGTEYAATLVGAVDEEIEIDPNAEGAVLVISRYDPGNPLGVARIITIGTFLALVAHLFFLGRSERKAQTLAEQTQPA